MGNGGGWVMVGAVRGRIVGWISRFGIGEIASNISDIISDTTAR